MKNEKIIIKCINSNVYAMNSYIVCSEDEAMIIDVAANPCFSEYDSFIDGRKLKHIIYTHGHFDHISGSDELREHYKSVPHIIHIDDAECFTDGSKNLTAMFSKAEVYTKADSVFRDEDTFTLGAVNFKVIHTPGHTKGCVCYYTEGHLFCGDTIFENGIGRTDFEGGSFELIKKSIEDKIFTLPENTLIYPGHNSYKAPLNIRKQMGIF